jgi:Ti-type conjugative transfer relaxase TraA
MALYHFTTRSLSRGTRNTVNAIAYRSGCELYDSRTGQTFDHQNKAVQHVELVLPKDAPQWTVEIQNLMAEDRQKGVQDFVDVVEGSETRINSRVWREFEFALHRELTDEQNIILAHAFVEEQISLRGMGALMNFHFDVDEKTGESKPHCHVAVTTRRLMEDGMGEKEREWNAKSLLLELREQWANYSNFYLKLFGHDVQIDHRSNKERGIEMEPQPKRGRGVLEKERRHQNAGEFVTDKSKAFQDVQLRNLYRIVRNPDIVLDIVTKHHSTFMWADVQKKLYQYVDEVPLFQRLEAKLKNSKELILLRLEERQDFNGVLQEQAIYTTRSMLKAEHSLIQSAGELGESNTHGVQGNHIKAAIAKANQKLEDHGGLSEDQIKAIHHLVDEGQIKCVVGIAGAGKTTALGVCHEIWKAEGYAVYGLAPTGKAGQNLEGNSLDPNGIPSTTLHKFLKSYEEGRCQYNSNSILVLDEGGMVDVGRFGNLLNAVKQLGVKLIVVGDGAQLQPVEAGPAFRLITERLGKSELTTVVRQKEEWQKEATVLFGQQRTAEAIQKYADKGCVHIVEEKLPSLKEVLEKKDNAGLVHLYGASRRVSSLIYREMAKDAQSYNLIKEHRDFEKYLKWKALEKETAEQILQKHDACRPILEARSIDPLKMALLFVSRKEPHSTRLEKARDMLKHHHLDDLIGIKGQTVDIRRSAKEELIHTWHSVFKENPEHNHFMLAYSNRDVNDLNAKARHLLKASDHLSKSEFTFTIKKEVEDDFDRTYVLMSSPRK